MTASPQKLVDLASQVTEMVDIFICGASFEERCLAVSKSLPKSRVNRSVIIFNETYGASIDANCFRLQEYWGDRCEVLTVSSDDPLLSFDGMIALLHNADERPRRILVDITTVTHETLMMLFQILSLCFQVGDHVDFVYATADDYSIGQIPSEKWLSKGVKEIRSVVGFPGRLVPSKNNHLVILLGFEEYRALSVVRELEPSLISVGYGDKEEASTGPHQETNERKVQRLRSLVGDVNEFVFSCYDPFSTMATLAELVGTKRSYNNIVAPMNTKLSTLGAAMLATDNDAVQLCYAQPTAYNTDAYSLAGTQFYIFPFREFKA